MMTSKSLRFLAALLLLSAPALALTVATSQPVYNPLSLVTISGTESAGSIVAIEVTTPSGSLLWLDTPQANSQGNYASSFTLPSSAETGIYNVTASFGGQRATTSFAVQPTQGPDFTIQLSSSSISVLQGENATLTASVQPVAGFASAVALSASGNPAGSTIAFSPTSATPSFSSTLTIGSGTAAAGTYTMTITGTGGGLTRTASLSLTIASPTAPPPPPPTPPPPAPPPPSGGGPGIPSACLQASIGADHANLTKSTLIANTVECWDINRPEIIAITYLSFSPSTTQSDVAIRIAKAAAPPATLQNAYQYLEIISSVPDSEIPNATLRFSLNRSWLNVTGVNKSEITLFRYTITSGATASNWNKLPTSIFGETPQYVTYQTLSPGLSFFAVAAPPPQCPVCPQPTEWATCQQQADASGLQTRTSYSCSAQTDYQCVSGQESRQCCPECPQPGEFGACTAGRQSRAVYACGDATGFKCTEQTENRNCVSQAEAQSAIAAAQTAITEASQQNKNVTQAQSLLLQAQGAFSAADYSQSKSLADQARNAALTAPVLVFPSPIPIIAPIVVTIIALAILLVLWRAKKIPWPRVTRPSAAQLCYIGREETVLGLRCSVCNRVVCTRHARSIAGRIYCAYHSPYGPRPPGPPGAPPPRAAPRPPVAPRR